MYSTFLCIPKRAPIMKGHCILTYLKSSIVLPPDDFCVSIKAGEKVFGENCSSCSLRFFVIYFHGVSL